MRERERGGYPWLLFLGLVVIIVLLVILVGVASVKAAECADGRRVVGNVWSFNSLSPAMQEEANMLISTAKNRDTRNATDSSGYRGGAVSRTLGARLRNEVRVRAPVSLDLQVFYRDPPTTRVVENLGILHVEAGTGRIRLPDDPRKWIIETIWPKDFMSPTISSGERRLWIFGEEWGAWCTMNLHGIVP